MNAAIRYGLAISGLALGGVLGACGGAPAGAAGGAGALSAASAASPAGAKVYSAQCASCHGKDGSGVSAPPAFGSGALPLTKSDRPEFKTAKDVYDYVSTEMPYPRSKSGSLSKEDYWAVVEYTLRAHGATIPDGGLTADNAGSITVNGG